MTPIKDRDIVILTAPTKTVGTWTFGHQPGTIGQVTFVRPGDPRYPAAQYTVRFLTRYVGCASLFEDGEIKKASPTTQRKYNAKFIKKLYGRCLKKGCSDTCKHSRGA